MRHALLALMVLLAGSHAATAQTVEWADKLFAKSGTSHNFGNVARGAVLSYRFPMENIYAVPLTIINTRVSCGCVTITPSVQVLQPRQSGYIDITMDARRFTGPKTVSIYISFGPQFVSTATLQVIAHSRTDIVFNPGEANFGVVASGQSPEQTIDVEYAGALDWKVTGVAPHSFPLEVKIDEAYRQPLPGNPSSGWRVGYRLKVGLKADAPPGPFRHELLLQTNDPQSPLVPLLAEGTVQARLSVVPTTIKMESGKIGQEITKKVVVSGPSQQPFRITGVEGAGDGLSADTPANAGLVHIITIRWKPMKAGALKRALQIATDLDGGAKTTVTVEGVGTP